MTFKDVFEKLNLELANITVCLDFISLVVDTKGEYEPNCKEIKFSLDDLTNKNILTDKLRNGQYADWRASISFDYKTPKDKFNHELFGFRLVPYYSLCSTLIYSMPKTMANIIQNLPELKESSSHYTAYQRAKNIDNLINWAEVLMMRATFRWLRNYTYTRVLHSVAGDNDRKGYVFHNNPLFKLTSEHTNIRTTNCIREYECILTEEFCPEPEKPKLIKEIEEKIVSTTFRATATGTGPLHW